MTVTNTPTVAPAFSKSGATPQGNKMKKERVKSVTLSKIEGSPAQRYSGLILPSISDANVRISKDEPAPDEGCFLYIVTVRFEDGYIVSDNYEHVKGKWPDLGKRFVAQFLQTIATTPSQDKRREAEYILEHCDFE